MSRGRARLFRASHVFRRRVQNCKRAAGRRLAPVVKTGGIPRPAVWRSPCPTRSTSMALLLLLGPVRPLLVAAAVFVPFERLAAANRAQRVFRRGWATDVWTGIANGLLLYTVLLVVLGGVDVAAAALAPELRAWAHARPLWAQ